MSSTAVFPEIEKALVSIVVPVFNEADNIVSNLDLLISEIEDVLPQFEIIVVSDGSTDETNLKVVSFRHPGIQLVATPENKGKGHAVRTGFQKAKGHYILFIDGGMELHPQEIRIFVGLINLYKADIVIGSKRHPQSRVDYPWYRKFLSFLFQLIVRSLFNIDVTDTQVGIKIFRRPVLEAILPHLEINRYGFDLELLSLAKVFGFGHILEAPVRLDYFNTNSRPVTQDILHVIRVGFSLLNDTWLLYLRMKELKKQKVKNEGHNQQFSQRQNRKQDSR